MFDFHAARVFSESQAGFEAEPTWLSPSSQLTRQRDLTKRGSLVQTRNPVLTHRAQLLQIPPFPMGIQPSPPPGTKTKPSLHQGLGENRLCAWGIKRGQVLGTWLPAGGLALRVSCPLRALLPSMSSSNRSLQFRTAVLSLSLQVSREMGMLF